MALCCRIVWNIALLVMAFLHKGTLPAKGVVLGARCMYSAFLIMAVALCVTYDKSSQ